MEGRDDPEPERAHGGRRAALEALAAIDPPAYGRTRNHLDGAVTRLSPYLRHGVLSLGEVRRAALEAGGQGAAYKLVDELSWRDYSLRVYDVLGERIWEDLEPYRTGYPAERYAASMPVDVVDGTTGLRCIDDWSADLAASGYLHNHVRMWLASYVVHHRRVAWQAGARWFLTHLLDGDASSNNLGWQWVAATWRHTPYLWNRDNLLTNGGARHCDRCPLQEAGCPFAMSYERLAERLFPDGTRAVEDGGDARATLRHSASSMPAEPEVTTDPVLVWVHGDRLSPDNEALQAYPQSPAVFVWDDELWQRNAYAQDRARFVTECLAEMPVRAEHGDVVGVLARRAESAGARFIATTAAPRPRFRQFVAELESLGLSVQIWHPEPFVAVDGPLNLTRHTPYWHAVKAVALDPTSAEVAACAPR